MPFITVNAAAGLYNPPGLRKLTLRASDPQLLLPAGLALGAAMVFIFSWIGRLTRTGGHRVTPF